MENWIHERLSDCLGFSVPEDLIQYVISIEGNRDVEDYLGTLLDFKNPKHRLFLSDYLQRRSNTSKTVGNTSNNQSNRKKKNKNATSNTEVDQKTSTPAATTKEGDERNNSAKKKAKFVNIYSPEAKNVILLKGRHHCDCQASKHKLINNCLQCGRIICEQEGSGPCLVCGNLVCSKEEQQVLGGGTRRSDALYNRLMEQKRPAGWEQALAQRNRLLEYDRTSEKRTQVIDDESDYFMSSSVWLSKNEREKLQKHEKEMREKRHASRLSQKVTLDFAGRQIVQEADFDPEIEENLLREIAKNSDKQQGIIDTHFPSLKINGLGDNVHPDLKGAPPMVKARMWIMNAGVPIKRPRINEALAIEIGANILAELIVFGVAAATIVMEVKRQRLQDVKTNIYREETLDLISQAFDRLELKCLQHEHQIKRMKKLIKKYESLAIPTYKSKGGIDSAIDDEHIDMSGEQQILETREPIVQKIEEQLSQFN